MENSETQSRPFSVAEVSQINNLDTARMALRWALERLSLLEAKTSESDAKLSAAEKARAEAAAAAEAARKALADREEHLKRVEDLVSLDPGIRNSVEALAKREAESQRAHESIVAGLKRRLSLAEEASRRSQSMTESREALLTERERQWLKEKEDIIVRAESTAHSSEHAWQKQKAKLVEELELARRKLQEQGEAVLEMERRTAEAEHDAAHAADLAESRRLLLAEQERQLLRERADLGTQIRSLESEGRTRLEEAVRRARESLEEELARTRDEADAWHRKYQETLNRFLEIEKRALESEERARRAEGRAKARDAAAGEQETAWLKEKASLLGELDGHRLRGQDLLSQVTTLEGRIATLESEAGRAASEQDRLAERERRLDEKARELTALAETLESKLRKGLA
ncbi:MAG: hypothetical protein WC943_12895 [Elusimicrobiota bacterium]|jgi:hypothetical protein